MNAKQLVSVNGAEWLDAEARTPAAGMTIPQYLAREARQAGTTLAQYIRMRCGF